jgi:hypothetical protein
VVVGAPDLAVAELDAIAAPPALVVLTNRFLAARLDDLGPFEARLADWGLTERNTLDAALTLVFRRPAPPGG